MAKVEIKMGEIGGGSIDLANPDAIGILTQTSNTFSTISTPSKARYIFVAVNDASCPLFVIDCVKETVTYVESGTKMTATWGLYVKNVTNNSVDLNFYSYMGGTAKFSYAIYC